jgi:hypothetical protein
VPNLYGSFKSFLASGFIQGLKPQDLPIALDWVNQLTVEEDSFDFERKRLTSEIIIKAWEKLEDKRVLESFVNVVIGKIRRYDELLEEYEARDALLAMRQDTANRKRLLRRLFPLLSDRADWLGLGNSFVLRLGNEDVAWLLDDFIGGDEVRTKETVLLILQDFLTSWHGTNPEVLQQIHSAMEHNDLIRKELSVFFQPVDLYSEQATQARHAYEQSLAHRRPNEKEEEEEPLTPSPSERVLRMLERFEQGDVSGWWQLNLEMTLDNNSKFYGNELEIDLRKLPGWTNAEHETQRRIIEAAKNYLLIGDPNTQEWIGTNTLYRPAFSGYRALWLLRNTDPDFIENLSKDVWRKWAPIIFHYPIYNGSGVEIYSAHRHFIGTVYRVVPDEITNLLLGEIDRSDRPDHFVDFERLRDCWDQDLIAALRQKLIESDLNPLMFSKVLTALIQHQDNETINLARKYLTLPIPFDEPAQERPRLVASALLRHEDEAGWDSVWPAIKSNFEFGRKVIESTVGAFRRGRVFKRLAEDAIGELYVWLSIQYPHSEDPHFPAGIAHAVGIREEIGYLRDSLLSNLRDRGSRESIQTIEKIAAQLPHLDWLKWTLLAGRKNFRQHSWKPLLPSEVISLRSSAGTLQRTKRGNPESDTARNRRLTLWDRPVDDIPNLNDLISSFCSAGDRFAFFVGAGLSYPLFPLWDELLQRMIQKCDSKKLLSTMERDELLALLTQKKELLNIAGFCVEKLGRKEYRAFLEDQFLKDAEIEKLQAYQELFRLRPSLIITTNFDQVPDQLNGSSFSLDSTSAASNSGHYRIFVNPNAAEAGNALRAGQRVFFKMHGCISNHGSIVFTYEDFRREIYTGRAKAFLHAIFNTQTVVFLGFGFSDPHVESILSVLQEANKGLASPHYVLAHDLSAFQKHTLEHKYGVRVINYTSSDGHPQVSEFIRFIKNLVS